MKTTNVKPSELNYDKYTTSKYDQDIVNSIPYHKELHEYIVNFIKKSFDSKKEYSILDLGVGTGITSKVIQGLLPKAKIDAVDFSKQMLAGARKKLGKANIRYILGDYSKLKFDKKYDIVVSVIGIHHQNNNGKRRLFNKIYSLLKPGGLFIFGDLVRYKNPYETARNAALHYHHHVEHTLDKNTLSEWAHHHMFLNDLAPVEFQVKWLEKSGFKVKKELLKIMTALLFCFKK